jgi:F-type H+-transporting ATPase subunit epsilon
MPIQLEIVTPDRIVFDEAVDFVQLRGKDGELGILPGHTPLCTALAPDVMQIKQGTNQELISIMGGLLEVRPNHITVLAPAAERATEIDELRAKEAQERAKIQVDKEKTVEAEAALQRALVRLRAVELLGSKFRR